MDIRRRQLHLATIRAAVILLLGFCACALSAPVCAQGSAQIRWQYLSAQDLGLKAITGIGFDSAGATWIGGQGAAIAIRSDGRRESYPIPNAEAFVTAISSDPAGATWLATDGAAGVSAGLHLVAASGLQSGFTTADGLADNHIRDLVQGTAGDIWLATAGGLGHRAPDGSWGRFTIAEGLVHDDLYALAIGDHSDLWIGAIAGLSHLSADGTWESFTPDNGLAAAWVHDLTLDALGNLWCATDAGASVRSAAGAWRTLHQADGLPADAVTAVAADWAGGVWLATDAGVAYRTPDDAWATLEFQRPLGIDDGPITRIGIDAQGRPWFIAPTGVSVLMAGGPAAGRPTVPPQSKAVSPTPTRVAAALATRKPAPTALLLLDPLPRSTLEAPFVMLGAMPISRTAFFIIFFALFTLAVIGAFLMLLRILLRLRRNGKPASPKPAEAATLIASADHVGQDDEILLPTRLSTDEPLAPEVAAALAELDRYANGATSPMALHSTAPAPAQEDTAASTAEADQRVSEPQPASPPPAEATGAPEAPTLPMTAADIPALFAEGQSQARAGNHAAAYDLFSAITRLAPDDVDAWMWKGATALHPQEAVRCLQRAVELAPDNERARAGLNWALGSLAAGEAPAGEKE